MSFSLVIDSPEDFAKFVQIIRNPDETVTILTKELKTHTNSLQETIQEAEKHESES